MGNDSMREFSEKYYAAAATSAANAGYCERLFVMDMGQHGFAEVSHLDHLMAVSGIDFIPSAIQQSQERTQAKADRLHFQVMDIAELDFPAASFDALASIDALYFCNLEERDPEAYTLPRGAASSRPQRLGRTPVTLSITGSFAFPIIRKDATLAGG